MPILSFGRHHHCGTLPNSESTAYEKTMPSFSPRQFLAATAWVMGCVCTTQVLAANDNPLDAFPKAETGFTRHVIQLPVGNFENDLKIELLPGKVIDVDCNTALFTGQLEEKTLDGWGYNYYLLPKIEGPVTTQMACPNNEKHPQFVPVRSGGSLLHYNSRMPVVVYLPKGVELRWRTWVATPLVNATAN